MPHKEPEGQPCWRRLWVCRMSCWRQKSKERRVQNSWFPKGILRVVPNTHTTFQIEFTQPEFKVQRQERPDP